MNTISKIQCFLDENGTEYLFGMRMSAIMFLTLESGIGIFGMIFACFLQGTVFVKMVVVLGFIAALPGIIIISNHNDNEDMLPDIKMIFERLKIQVRSGVYIIDALENCIDHIHNKRLRKSMQKLVNEVYLARDFNQALDHFSRSFRNLYVETLMIIIKQSLETGYSVENLNNAFEQMIDVEHAINIRMENAIERNTQILQVLFMSGIIAISVYCSFVEFQNLFQFY